MQPTPTLISLREARELVTQRYLSPALAGKFLVEWLDDENEPVRWQYEHVENNSGISTDAALKRFWRPGGLSINWEESSAARRVEPPPVAAPGGVTPGGVVWASHNPKPVQPVSQLGYNFIIYGIRLAHEDIERRLAGYDEPAKPRGATEQWVYNRMKSDPSEKVSEDDYAGKIFPDRPDKSVGLNLVADIRRELKLPSPHKPHKQ